MGNEANQKANVSPVKQLMDNELRLLSEGLSTQATNANRVWITLAIISIVTLVSPENEERIKIPFDIGDVPAPWFYLISSLLLSALLIAFCTAQAMTLNAQNLALNTIKKVSENWETHYKIHPHDLYDSIIQVSMLQVSPVPTIFKGKYKYHSEKEPTPAGRAIISQIFYFCLKMLGIVVFYGLPTIALIRVYIKYFNQRVPDYEFIFNIIIGLFIIIVSITVVTLLIFEITYMKGAITATLKKSTLCKNTTEIT